MPLSLILIFAVLFCALVIAVQSGESRAVQIGSVAIIVLQVLSLLIMKGNIIEIPWGDKLLAVIPALVVGLALFTTFRTRERSLALVMVFAALLHFFVSVAIVERLH
ncbi:MAG: hypothetical protein AB1486_26465 [Planctomycetota bacterium]